MKALVYACLNQILINQSDCETFLEEKFKYLPTILGKDCQMDFELVKKQGDAFTELNSEALQLAIGVLPMMGWQVAFL